MSALPLSGIRVVEFTWVIAGPLLTKYLALLGAEVIRIESAKRVEFREREGGFALLNNNKRSCCLDLSQPRAREIAREIVMRGDVVVENFGAGVLDRLGLGYADLSARKPDLVMLSCSGLGRTGPDRDKVAYGTLLQLFSGWSLLQGHPGTEDILVGGAWTDPLAASTGAFALLAALHHRQRTGEGQHVDFSMMEATICGLPEALLDFSMNRRLPVRQGNRDAIFAPHGCYPCQGDDQWIAIAVTTEEQWQALARALGNPVWTREDRFADAARRKQNEDALDARLGEWTAARPRATVARELALAGVPAGAVMKVADLVADPHLDARGTFVELDSPGGRPHLTIGAPLRVEPGGMDAPRPAPRLGQDNAYVFQTLLGMSDAEVAELIESGVAY